MSRYFFVGSAGSAARAIFAPLLFAVVALGGMAVPGAAQEAHVLIVAGLGGEPQYRESFLEWGTQLSDAAVEAGVKPENLIFLAEDPETGHGKVRARSTREEIERAFRETAERAAPQDRVLVVLIGHGTGSGEESRVSIPGRSLTLADYRGFLELLAPRMVAFVNVASASGDFASALAGEGRVVVTATRSSQQRNAAIFGGHFVKAFIGEGADLDRDGRVSILEAFEFGRLETERHYRDRGLISPEQALLEDRAQGSGVPLPMEDEAVGTLAGRFFLESVVPATVAGDASAERLRELYLRQEALEVEVAALGQRRGTMEPAAYQAALEPLLLELATVGQEIRRLEEGR
ncbi:MAG: hypothetical protein WEG36_01880 [Gemmatimonadota bacterium]